MKAELIVNAVEATVDSLYTKWTIGVTDHPVRTREAYEQNGYDVSNWEHWTTNSEMEARAVKGYFTDKGMGEDDGSGGNASYVYIF